MTAMRIRPTPALTAVLMAVVTTVRCWSSAGASYPDCAAQHGSNNNNGGGRRRRREQSVASAHTSSVLTSVSYGYGGGEDAVDEAVSSNGDGNGIYYNDNGQAEYVEPWSPYNGVAALPRVCTDPASNPRGFYTSNLAPCRLQFHKIISNDVDASSSSSSSYELSTACSKDNQVGKISAGSALYEYVRSWPDECVGSFPRCYSLAKDEHVFIAEACRQGYVFPEGTTHVSLDCTEDRADKQQAMDKVNNNNNNSTAENDPVLRAQQKHVNDEIHEMEKVIFIIVAVVLVSCLGCIYAAYVLVVQPYQETVVQERRGSNRTERAGLVMGMDTDDDETRLATTTTSSNAGQGLSEVQLT
jgi:hypothetical protein